MSALPRASDVVMQPRYRVSWNGTGQRYRRVSTAPRTARLAMEALLRCPVLQPGHAWQAMPPGCATMTALRRRPSSGGRRRQGCHSTGATTLPKDGRARSGGQIAGGNWDRPPAAGRAQRKPIAPTSCPRIPLRPARNRCRRVGTSPLEPGPGWVAGRVETYGTHGRIT